MSSLADATLPGFGEQEISEQIDVAADRTDVTVLEEWQGRRILLGLQTRTTRLIVPYFCGRSRKGHPLLRVP
jgi:hypothetical protein